MTMTPEDIELIRQLIRAAPDAPVSALIDTAPERPVSDIKAIIEAMSAAELKRQFGTNTFAYKFIGIKDFMRRHNIVSGSKWAPTLTYEHKHAINRRILSAMPAKQRKAAVALAKRTLKAKLDNPPRTLYGRQPSAKQLAHITSAVNAELQRWND